MRKKIIRPSLTIGGVEFKCMSRQVTLEPGDAINFCEDEWTLSVEVELWYGEGGSWNELDAMRDTLVEFVLSPSDGAISAENPQATFEAMVPAIPFMSGAQRDQRQTFTLDIVTESEPVFDEAGS
jgi:hypothetical protein